MKKRLVYVTNNIAPFRVDLLDELAKYFSEVFLCYFNEIDRGVNPEYVKKRPKNVKMCCLGDGTIFDAYKTITDSDYIIFDGYSGKKKMTLIWLCQLKKKKYMISIDGIIKKNDTSFFKTYIKRKIIKKATTVFSTNSSTDCIIREMVPNVDISRHIFSTVRESDIIKLKNLQRKALKEKYGFFGNASVILFVGKFIQQKGVRELVECARNNDKQKFIMVGGTKEQLENIGMEMPDNIKIIEYLEKEDILLLMKCSDVFVLPTYTDVWGLVIVEAAMCGVPIVTTDKCNAGVELIEDGKNGFIIPIRNSIQLEDAIKKALLLNRMEVEEFDSKKMEDYTIEKSAKIMQNNIYIKG